MKILIVNGPNLNALGQREVNIYGSETLEKLEKQWIAYGKDLGIDIEVFQSNIEGEIIDYLYKIKRFY
jgi:3-dehydroquinate dehydratase II